MDDKMAIYREEYDNSNMKKVLFGIGFEVTFLDFSVGDRPPPWNLPCLEGALVPKMHFFGSNASFSHMLLSGT